MPKDGKFDTVDFDFDVDTMRLVPTGSARLTEGDVVFRARHLAETGKAITVGTLLPFFPGADVRKMQRLLKTMVETRDDLAVLEQGGKGGAETVYGLVSSRSSPACRQRRIWASLRSDARVTPAKGGKREH